MWQPIETVPKDGTPVLVLLERELCGSRIQAAHYGPNKGIGVIATVFAFDAPKATHWMPQPETPNAPLEAHAENETTGSNEDERN